MYLQSGARNVVLKPHCLRVCRDTLLLKLAPLSMFFPPGLLTLKDFQARETWMDGQTERLNTTCMLVMLSNRLKTSDSLYVSCPAMVHRVAVIGTGSSGLACAKACVDEGLEPICFERGHDIGGVWNFKVSGDETCVS